MNAGNVVWIMVLLLSSALITPASAQRPTGQGERGGGFVGVGRGGGGRTVVGSSRPDHRERQRGHAGRGSVHGDRPGPFGRVGPFPRDDHPPALHHGTRFARHGLYVGAHCGSAFIILASPWVYSAYTYAAPYSMRYSASGARTLMQGDLGEAADALGVEKLPGGVLRLTWRPDGRAVGEVGLFLADAQQKVLAVQTLRAPPFSALFESTHEAAYVGVTVAYADGQSATTLLPYPSR